MKATNETRLLTAAEFYAMDAGVGWWESWLRPDDEDIGPEGEIMLERCAWAGPNAAFYESGYSTKDTMLHGDYIVVVDYKLLLIHYLIT